MSEILDKAQALEQAGGNAELAQELFGMLLKELPGLMDKLVRACQDNNNADMWDSAHKIYGSTAYCGVPALQEAARQMENTIKQANQAQLTPSLEALGKEIERLLEVGPALLAEEWP